MLEISSEHIWLNQQFGSWKEAIQQISEQLLEKGVIQKEYIDAMVARQEAASVYIGNFVALPHGKAKDEQIVEEGIFLFQVPDGVDFGIDEEKKVATILFAVIMRENQQLTSLQELAFFCSDVDQVMALSDAQTVEEIQQILKQAEEF